MANSAAGGFNTASMIRHQVGNDPILFTQDDHARFSGLLAERLGNSLFTRPQPRRQVIDAVSLHDCGWVLHDQAPTLNEQGKPLDVFETPVSIAVRVWGESVRRVAEVDPYAGFLVSIHVFHLSAMAYQHHTDPEDRRRHAKELFDMNKFQQNQIEFQERQRLQMGLRTDIALELGLAPRGSGAMESQLRQNYQTLRMMDQISLAVLRDDQPFASIDDVAPHIGSEPLNLQLRYPSPWTVSVTPWPFDADRIEAMVPCRRLTGATFPSAEALAAQYHAAPVQGQAVRVIRG